MFFFKDLHQEDCDNHDILDVSEETELTRIYPVVRNQCGKRPFDARRIREDVKEIHVKTQILLNYCK
jgi:hypothetical protein